MAKNTLPRSLPASGNFSLHLGEFGRFAKGMLHLADMLPERLTSAQAAFFLQAALADLRGNAMTFTQIKEAVGDKLSRSMHTTYKVFIAGGRMRDRENQTGLNWLTQVVNPMDNRQKFLHLTDEGRDVMRSLLAVLNDTQPRTPI